MAEKFVPNFGVPEENKKTYEKLLEQRSVLIIDYEKILELLYSQKLNVFNYGFIRRKIKKKKPDISSFIDRMVRWKVDSEIYLLTLTYQYGVDSQKNFVHLQFKIIMSRWIDEMTMLYRIVLDVYNNFNNRIFIYKSLRIAYLALLLTAIGVIACLK